MSESTLPPLTLERAKELAAEVVADMGAEYVYVNPSGIGADGYGAPDHGDFDPDCYYVHADQPGCIVGHILHKHGVPLRELGAFELEGASSVVAGLFNVSKLSPVAEYLSKLQVRQDEGATWGQALTDAELPED